MKSVLISIQPKWCELIASGEKTIEVRKSCPQLQTPFKCYIYCTKNKDLGDLLITADRRYVLNAHIIGEFVCDRIELLFNTTGNPANYMKEILPDILQKTALSYKEFQLYTNSRATRNSIYGWHISDLKIYDKPKELGEFWKAGKCPYNSNDGCNYKYHCFRSGESNRCGEQITCPPQSWCYVEEL